MIQTMAKMFNYEADYIHSMVHPNLLTDSTHYVAECKDIILTEATPNYPKLTDYESEWLYFYENEYTPGTPVDLEYQKVIVNPYGSVENAIPFKYKSAILKGNTLNNLINATDTSITSSYIQLNSLTYNPDGTLTVYNLSDKAVIMYFNKSDGSYASQLSLAAHTNILVKQTAEKILTKIRGRTSEKWGVENTALEELKKSIVVLSGDYTNINVPYFEGMQSVKKPVLTTIGENLFDVDYLESVQKLMSIERVKDGVRLKANEPNAYRNAYSKSFKVEKGKYYNITYTVDNENPNNEANVTLKNITGASFPGFYDCSITGSGTVGKTFTAGDSGYVRVHLYASMKTDNGDYYVTYTNVMISEVSSSSNVTVEYKPYKSNILTVNEDVELRGIGEVRDTVDLMTGELTKRIGEVVLSENNVSSGGWSNETHLSFDVTIDNGSTLTNKVTTTSNAFKGVIRNLYNANSPEEFVTNTSSGKLIVMIRKNRLETPNKAGFIKWLQTNPVVVQYQLETESVKTVDLIPLNKPEEGTNHYQLTSNITCEAILEVPVVSTGKQTLEEINND